MPLKDRGNVVLLSRHLTAVINDCDEGGVLTGNWSGNYSGGVQPSSWTGSGEILKQYVKKIFFWVHLKTKNSYFLQYLTRKPVKYGQCWVFGGVLTTVCRWLESIYFLNFMIVNKTYFKNLTTAWEFLLVRLQIMILLMILLNLITEQLIDISSKEDWKKIVKRQQIPFGM